MNETFTEIWNFKILALAEGNITVRSIVIGLTVLIVGIVISSILSKKFSTTLASRFKFDRSMSFLFKRVLFYVFSFIALLIALKFAKIPLTIFTVLGGAFAIGVGFGSQNLVSNFLSGMILMIERPIKVGDFIEVDSIYGEVEEIGVRSTGIQIYGNRHIIVPNSSFLEKNVINWTRRNKIVRLSILVGVAYGSDTALVASLLEKAVQSHPRYMQEPACCIYFKNFGDNSLEFEVNFTVLLEVLNDKRSIESEVRFEIDKLFRENNVTIAFPQRDVHLFAKEPIPVKNIDG